MKFKLQLLSIIVFAGFSVWWFYLRSKYSPGDPAYKYFTASYGLVALMGAVWGFLVSKKWGGIHSVLGRALSFFALGLFAQEVGQLSYNYYIYVKKIDIPYPSIGDIGYFGSVICYIIAAALVAKTAGASFSIKSSKISKITTAVIPILLVGASYLLFLRGYEFDWHHPLTVFLDFGYPFGEAIYISIAVLAYILSRKLLGGIMRKKIVYLIIALLAQYVADFNFVYQANKGTWADGGYGDYIYLVAYFILGLALLNIVLPQKTSETSSSNQEDSDKNLSQEGAE